MEDNRKKELIDYYTKSIKEAIDDLKSKNKKHKQIPNILSAIRLFSPFFIVPAAALSNMSFTICFIAFFSVTDLVDGVIARKYNLKSSLGEDLDALADKVFAVTMILAAAFIQPAVIINFLYELAISSINFKAKVKNQNPKSHIIGKIKTFLLYPLIGISFLSSIINIELLFNIFFVGTTILQTATSIVYLFKYKEDIFKVSEDNNKEK